MNMLQLFQPGDKIYGFCNGFFGRDHYDDVICVYVRPKYAVFESENGTADVLNLSQRLIESANLIPQWKTQPPPDERD